MKIFQAIKFAAGSLGDAIAADFHELSRRHNPWHRQQEMANDIDALRGRVKVCEALEESHARHIEILRAVQQRFDELTAHVAVLDEQFATLYELQNALDTKQLACTSQIVEFSGELEKIRLRLSAPAQDAAPQRPENWTERRRRLEHEYATKHVNAEETTDAVKNNAS